MLTDEQKILERAEDLLAEAKQSYGKTEDLLAEAKQTCDELERYEETDDKHPLVFDESENWPETSHHQREMLT